MVEPNRGRLYDRGGNGTGGKMIYPLTDATTGRKANAYEHSACQPSVSAGGASGGGVVDK